MFSVLMLSVLMLSVLLSVLMLIVLMLNVLMLNVLMLNVLMLSVVVPRIGCLVMRLLTSKGTPAWPWPACSEAEREPGDSGSGKKISLCHFLEQDQ
jgi:hypothetical protein